MCEFCESIRKLKVTGGYDEVWDSYSIADGHYVGAFVAKDEQGPFIYAVGEDITDKYYITFCPKCGSKL